MLKAMQPRGESQVAFSFTWVALAAPSCRASCPAAIEDHQVPLVDLVTAQRVWGQVTYFQSRELLQEIRKGHPEEQRGQKGGSEVGWLGREIEGPGKRAGLPAAVDQPGSLLLGCDTNEQSYLRNLSLWSASLFLKNLPLVSASHTELEP